MQREDTVFSSHLVVVVLTVEWIDLRKKKCSVGDCFGVRQQLNDATRLDQALDVCLPSLLLRSVPAPSFLGEIAICFVCLLH
jgi:hypothetical protein